jgi:hypothetical protein
MLNVCDSRFQPELQAAAVRARKLRSDYVIPEQHRNNVPHTYTEPLAALRRQGMFPPFPFGTDLTPDEQRLGRAPKGLAAASKSPRGLTKLLLAAAKGGHDEAALEPLLRRMDLDQPRGPREHLYRRLLIAALSSR